ncbi:MAG: enoyl-CoA hydratase/isomerase family protein [Sphingomonadaceae bacterium]|nr:enoyl-CoA hydratase/isomerase family protein [Sphingomonadaceae bacterium]
MSEAAPTVLVGRDDGVATITLNAPERLNAVDSEMGQRLDRAFAEAGSDPDVRVIVVTGAGRGFCAGASMARLAEVREKGLAPSDAVPPEPEDIFARFADAPPQLRTRYTIPLAIPKPVIAAVNGPAAGAGLGLALACDIRLAAKSAKFIGSFAARGLIAEAAAAYLLPRIAGWGLAADMLLSARPVGAEEALRAGLVTMVAPDRDFPAHVADYARTMARTNAPASLCFIKDQLRRALTEDMPASIDHALAGTRAAVAGADFAEGLRAYAEKRPPRFAPLDSAPKE